MALPAITPYPMPSAGELPSNRVAWQPAPDRALLLIHDMQHHFLNAFTAEQPPIPALIDNIRRLHASCSAQGIPVVYSAQPGGQTPQQRGLLQDFWGQGIEAGPHGQQIVAALAPGANDTLITKWRYSAFRRTELLDLMRQHRRDQLIICGIYAHIGCLQTASDAFMSDLQPFLIADALADFSPEHHQMALRYAAQLCAVVLTTDQLVGALGQGEPTQDELGLARLRADVAALLDEPAEALDAYDNLLDRGLDSIRLMTLVERWRRAGAEISFVDLAERPTLAEWHELIAAQRA